MEASALRAPARARRPLTTPLLRLRSDEQLLTLFRAGSEEAFATLHDRYRQRLFAYVRQMLAAGSRADAEDVLQDVFVRAYASLRAGTRDVQVRAWLYRVAHNRCIDQLRRPVPPTADILMFAGGPLQDPIETAQRRDDLRRLVADVARLPAQQRSALLMREIDGLAYADIAAALDVTLPAVKSLLVRARMGLVEAIEARETECGVIREDLADSCERGVKTSARARRHLRECDGCREYRTALRGTRRSFAALTPAVGFGPLALAAKAIGGGGAALGGGKAAAVVCTAALATGTAVEVERKLGHERSQRAATPPGATPAPVTPATAAAVAPVSVDPAALAASPPPPHAARAERPSPDAAIVAPAPPARAPRVTALLAPAETPAPAPDTSPPVVVVAPEEVEPVVATPAPVTEAVGTPTPEPTLEPPAATPPPAPTPVLGR